METRVPWKFQALFSTTLHSVYTLPVSHLFSGNPFPADIGINIPFSLKQSL